MMMILFILKVRQVYENNEYSALNSGLYNSANFVVNMLNEQAINAKLVQAIDNNCIDRLVTEYKPDTVVIEALWVVPEKFEILQKLHPDVHWIVRLHSDSAFLANEGIAIEWLLKYQAYDAVSIAANSQYLIDALEDILPKPVLYFPNYYPVIRDYVNIGCFGAVRPMKNHLTQALAAIKYATNIGKTLRFHINGNRTEQKGDNVLKNLRALFDNSIHELVEHPWMDHQKFLEVVKSMDAGLQVSLSETYNIVAADFVSQGIPIVTSSEIPFVSVFNKTSTKDVSAIARKIEFVINNNYWLSMLNKKLLLKDAGRASRSIINLFN